MIQPVPCHDEWEVLATVGEIVPADPPQPVIDRNASNAGGWMLLGIVLILAVCELWLIRTGRPTISQWVQRKTTGRAWWKWFGIVSIGLLLWHLFEGGPL